MKTAAIICEFNPLHFGHTYILGEIRKRADCVIAVMSGNFVQRAEPALMNKYTRAEFAVRGGADLVVELPPPFSSASAEYFAGAGVEIAGMLGADMLAFGVGCPDTKVLCRAAEVLSDPAFSEELRAAEKENAPQGIASLREKCLKKHLGTSAEKILRSPNDILAIEYMKKIRSDGMEMEPCPISRLTEAENPMFLGATGIRALFSLEGTDAAARHVPDFVRTRLADAERTGGYAFPEALSEIAFLSLRTSFARPSVSVADGDGGLTDRLYRAAQTAKSAEEMLSLASTKKYTNARIRRVLLNYLLGITQEDMKTPPCVTTLLAANEIGRMHLSRIRKSSRIRILTKPADYRSLPDSLCTQYLHTLRADALYTMCCRQRQAADYFLKQKPFQPDLKR